jgi:hypothetical protein
VNRVAILDDLVVRNKIAIMLTGPFDFHLILLSLRQREALLAARRPRLAAFGLSPRRFALDGFLSHSQNLL